MTNFEGTLADIPFIGGMLAQRKYNQERDTADLKQKLDLENLLKMRAEMDTYRMDEPLRAAKRSSGIATSGLEEQMSNAKRTDPGYIPSVLAGPASENALRQAQANEITTLLPTRQREGAAKAQAEEFKNAREALEELDKQMQIIPSLPPSERQRVYNDYVNRIGDPQTKAMMQRLPYNVGVQQLRNALLNSVKQQQERALQTQKDEAEMARTRQQGANQAAVARIQAEGRLENERQHAAKLRAAITAGKHKDGREVTEGDYHDYTAYLMNIIENLPEIKQRAAAFSMSALPPNAAQMAALEAAKAKAWDRLAPPSMRNMNPYKERAPDVDPAKATPGTELAPGIKVK